MTQFKTNFNHSATLCLTRLIAMVFLSTAPLFGQKILSLAPSLTESVCDLGLCEQLVGVTDHCLYPPQVQAVEKIGGYLEPNFEKIAMIRPDLILALPEHRDASSRLLQLGYQVETLQNYTLADIHETLYAIGSLTGKSEQAKLRVSELLSTQKTLERKGAKPLRCIMVLGHGQDTQPVNDVYAVGRKGFLNELLTLAGGDNAIGPNQPFFPKLGPEGLMALNPDVIFELIPEAHPIEGFLEIRKNHWKKLSHLKAVQNNRVFLFAKDHVLQAGPRYLETLRFLSETLEQL